MKLDQNDRSRMSVMCSRLYSLLRFIHSSTAGGYDTTKTTQEMRDSTTSKSPAGLQSIVETPNQPVPVTSTLHLLTANEVHAVKLELKFPFQSYIYLLLN